jgi:signal transduction histidine kinase
MFLKNELRQINKTLDLIKNEDTNTKLTTQTFNQDVCELCNNINGILDENRRVKVECERSNTEFKRAITNISHDMRTPLTSAIGYLQMLQGENVPAEKQAEYINIVESRLQSLSVLMNALFDFAQIIEGSKEELVPIKLNLCNVLRETMAEFYGELESRDFTVELDIPDEPVFVMCDESAIKRVLANLLKNVCVHGQDFLRVVLRDDAIEIANKTCGEVDTERIFERFYTADASRTGKNTGLGLAIARELTERMGGEISARVEGEMLVVQYRYAKPPR